MKIPLPLVIVMSATSLVCAQEDEAFRIAQWSLGMLRVDAESSEGTLKAEPVNEDGLEFFSVEKAETFLNQEGTVSMAFESDRLASLRFSFRASAQSVEQTFRPQSYPALDAFCEGLFEYTSFFGPDSSFHKEKKRDFFARVQTAVLSSGRTGANSPGISVSSKHRARINLTIVRLSPSEISVSLEAVDSRSILNKRQLPPGSSLATSRGLGMPSAAWTCRMPGLEGQSFKRPIASINALLVRPLESGSNAAAAMKLTATAVMGRTDGNIDFNFNQAIGMDMRKATEEVVRAVAVRNQTFPANADVRFGFADKWGGKDGPSAAVACALLLESMLHGFEIPTNFAVTGDLNSDSSVQPVGGVADKIRGAMDGGCDLIGVPFANLEDVNDLVVEENLRRFLTAKVFVLSNLDEALVLVDPARMSDAQRAALADLDAFQKQISAKGAAIYAPESQQRLGVIVSALPNCYTARILMAASRRTLPTQYSLAGTLVRIDTAMEPFSQSLKQLNEGKDVAEFRFGRNNPIQEAKNRLAALRTKSDSRLVPVIDAQHHLVNQFQRFINAESKSTTVNEAFKSELDKAVVRSREQWKLVKENQIIQDELMRRGIRFDE